MKNPELDDKLNEMLSMTFMGLYGRSPSANGMDFDFVPMEDSYNVLRDSLKDDIKELIVAHTKEVLERLKEKKVDYLKGYNVIEAIPLEAVDVELEKLNGN